MVRAVLWSTSPIRQRVSTIVWLLAVPVLTSGLVSAAASAAQVPPREPIHDPGAALYRARCADCHGIDAAGVRGPDLRLGAGSDASDDQLLRTIRRGVPGTEMPSFSDPESEIRAIIRYLRGLSAVAGVTPGAGSAASGAQIYQGSCARCHAVEGRGGRVGPDLSRVGLSRSRTFLAKKIRDASAAIVPGYTPISIVTSSGDQIVGVKKNEDAYSIQVMDQRERLRGFLKSDVRTVTALTRSLMPDFGVDRLGDRELDDLLAYLTGLGRGR